MSEKEIIGAGAVAIGLISYGIYLWQIYRRTVKPHVFTWLLWGLLTSIGFAAQYAENAGAGAWILGLSSLANFVIAALAYFYGEKNITKSDWVSFIIALSAIPVWMATSNPFYAVIIISIIDAVAFYPTFRKSWKKPQEESALSFTAMTVPFALSIFALEKITLTTALYPATIVTLNTLLIAMLLWRRKRKKK
jgi:chromate transport protein ChrA